MFSYEKIEEIKIILYFYKKIMRKFDTHWNYISSVDMVNGKTKYVLFLKDQWKRELWILNKEKDCLEVKRDPDRHTYRNLDAYGFNDTLLRQLDPGCRVVVKQKGTFIKLSTTVDTILKKGIYQFFLQDWFEKQVFLKKSDFKMEL